MELPIALVVNVTLTQTPSGLDTPNVNSLALFTNEPSGNIDQYGIYHSTSGVANDFGTDSVTAEMANAIFAQTPNILSGGGRLVVLPLLDADSATQGKFVSASLTSTLAALILVDDGDIKITVDGTAHNLTGLNFTQCVGLVDIAAVIQQRLNDCVVTATTSVLTVTSNKVGSTSTIVLAAVSGGTGTDLSSVSYLKVSSGTPTAGANSDGETIEEAIARTKSLVQYFGVITNLALEDAAIEAASDAVQAQDLIFLQHVANPSAIAGIGTTIQEESNIKTRILLHTATLEEANLFKAAYSGRGFSVEMSGSNTASTMNLKSLSTISPDQGITETLYAAADEAGVDLYVSYQGVAAVYSTGGNEFFDNVYADAALKFALETAGFNYLRQTSTKVPQTEKGMAGLKNAYSQVMEQFVRNGYVAPGAWSSSDTFGDPATFKANIEQFGFYIYSTPIALQNQTDRENRKAPLVQIAFKRAGAMHTSDVIVIVNA